MEKLKPYLTFSHPPPGPVAFLFKKAAEKNAALLREKTVEEHREALERLAEVRLIAPGARFEQQMCGGVPCEWVYRPDSRQDRVVLYLHGGSWAYGNLKTARAVGMMLSVVAGCRVLVAEYRLAPEHPYPAAAEDCRSLYGWLLENGYLSHQIAVFGDSAGGNLTLSLMHRLLSEGVALPTALGLASPVPDMSEHGALYRGMPDLLYTQYQGREQDILSLYCTHHDRRDPLISPVYGDLAGFPPMLIHVGQDEPLCIDCDLFAQKAHDAGVDVMLKIWRGMYHDFTTVGVTLHESRKSLQELGAFFRRHLSISE